MDGVERMMVDAPGGRVLEVEMAGAADGIAVILHHGTPSTGRLYAPFVIEAEQRGVRLVGYSRPGYVTSTRAEGRTVGDCAADVAAVMDHLGVDRFLTVGWSGGGPHTLASAALLPERVAACATIAGVAPYPAEGLDWMDGMGKENHVEFGAALAGAKELQPYLEKESSAMRDVRPEQVAALLGDLVSDVDKASLTGEFASSIAEDLRDIAAAGIWGWFDDDLAFTKHWGFELADIRVPVTVWQGAQDRMVPFAHGPWLAAHIPGAGAELRPEHGHLSLGVDGFGEILDRLLASARS